MVADPRFDAGRFRSPANDAVSVLLEKGIGGKLAGPAMGGTEEDSCRDRRRSRPFAGDMPNSATVVFPKPN